MEKIQWKNNEPPAISAENLNQMQDNIDSAKADKTEIPIINNTLDSDSEVEALSAKQGKFLNDNKLEVIESNGSFDNFKSACRQSILKNHGIIIVRMAVPTDNKPMGTSTYLALGMGNSGLTFAGFIAISNNEPLIKKARIYEGEFSGWLDV